MSIDWAGTDAVCNHRNLLSLLKKLAFSWPDGYRDFLQSWRADKIPDLGLTYDIHRDDVRPLVDRNFH